MPSTLTYPGVYVEEIPSGVRSITGVATSITAFVGRARRGPVNKPITINSYADFERKFGGLWAGSKLGFAVRDFYLNGGSRAIIVRLYAPLFENSAAQQAAHADAVTKATAEADKVIDAVTTAAAAGGATKDSVSQAAAGVAAAAADGAGKLAAQALASVASNEAAKAAATPDSVKDAVAAARDEAIEGAANEEAPNDKAKLDAKGLKLEAAYPGEWGNELRARVDHDVSEAVAEGFGLAKEKLFNLTVRDNEAGVTELFRNVTAEESPRKVKSVLENESKLVRVAEEPVSRPDTHPNTGGKDPFSNPNWYSAVAESEKASDGKALTEASFTSGEAKKEGLFALEDADLFNLLCIPPYTATGDVDKALIDPASQYCKKRRAMFLIDPPSGWNDKDKAKSGVGSDVGSPDENAAVFFPRLRQRNPLRDNQPENFAPCGAVAGLFARIDTERGVWKAPAGLDATLVGVPELSVPLTDAEIGELNPLGVNCLRNFPAAGRVCWGSRTRVGDDRLASEWKYIPVRRTALFIEESLYRGTQWVVFEPNDEPLWAQIRLNIGAFMNRLFRQGAFQGKTPRDAYFVKCDKETTTPDDINQGVVNIIVGFAPLKPAEFVVIKLQQMAGEIPT